MLIHSLLRSQVTIGPLVFVFYIPTKRHRPLIKNALHDTLELGQTIKVRNSPFDQYLSAISCTLLCLFLFEYYLEEVWSVERLRYGFACLKLPGYAT